MVVYGDSGYFISVSVGIDGADSETVGPDETKDTIYFWAESYKPDRQNKDKMKERIFTILKSFKGEFKDLHEFNKERFLNEAVQGMD